MAEGKVGHRRSAETEGRTRPGPDGIGTGPKARRISESQRAPIRPDPRAGEKAAGRRGEDQGRRESSPARGSDGGRHRPGRLKLDAHSGFAFAGRRTPETAPARRTPA